MRIMDVLFSDLSLYIISSTWACMVTSKAVVGSSAMSSLGLQARAIAMTTLCFIPPENWCGYSPKRSAGIPTLSSMFSAHFLASCLDRLVLWFSITSIICSPTVSTGFREVIGSWNIMDMSLPRMASIPLVESFNRSCPSKITSPPRILPGGLGISLIIPFASVVFPAPVSPTSPRVSPTPICILTPFSAFTTPSSVS